MLSDIQNLDNDIKGSSFNGNTNGNGYVVVKLFRNYQRSVKYIRNLRRRKIIDTSVKALPISKENFRVFLSNVDNFQKYEKFYEKEIKK